MIRDKTQGSVAAYLRLGGLFSYHYVFVAKFGSERNSKISERLAKFQAKRLIALCALFTLP